MSVKICADFISSALESFSEPCKDVEKASVPGFGAAIPAGHRAPLSALSEVGKYSEKTRRELKDADA